MQVPTEPKYVIFVDIETTGPWIGKNEMIEFAAVLVNVNTGQICKTFYTALGHRSTDGLCFDADCLRYHFLKTSEIDGKTYLEHTNKRLKSFSSKNPDATETSEMRLFHKFMLECYNMAGKSPNNIRIFSDTDGYDFAWLDYYLSKTNVAPSLQLIFKTYHPPRCISSIYVGMALHRKSLTKNDHHHHHHMSITDDLFMDSDDALKILGFVRNGQLDFPTSFNGISHDHDPLNDASFIALSFVHVLATIQNTK